MSERSKEGKTKAIGNSRTRGQSAGVDRDRIIEAARGIPLKRLTMQAVADRLGVDRSALHYHVPDRTSLIELVAGDLFDNAMSPGEVGPDTDWREGCLTLARATRDSVLASHHFAFYLRLALPAGEQMLELVEDLLRKMRDDGVDKVAAGRGIVAIAALSVKLAQDQLAVRAGEHPQFPEVRRALDSALPDRYPVLRAMFESDDDAFDDANFDESIRALIDGIALRAGVRS